MSLESDNLATAPPLLVMPSVPALPKGDLGRWLGQATAFCLVTLALLVLLEGLARALCTDDIALKLREVFAGTQDHGGLLLGSSVAEFGLVPEEFARTGLDFFNLGIRGAGPVYQEKLYHYYRATGRRPKVVIWALESTALAVDKLNRPLESESAYMPWPVFWDLLRSPGTSRTSLLYNRLVLIRERWQLPYILLHHRQNSPFVGDMTRYDQGWAPLPAGCFNGKDHPGNIDMPAVDPQKVAALRRLVRQLRADGARVVLLENPILHAAPATIAHNTALMHTACAGLDVPFWNYNLEHRFALGNEKESYFDCAHMNVRGAHIWSRQVAQDLDSWLRTGSK